MPCIRSSSSLRMALISPSISSADRPIMPWASRAAQISCQT
jgi:hypothetical protein